MLYSDGQNGILMLGGVYASGLWGWGLVEMCVFGLILIAASACGGLIGGWMDERVGPKAALLVEVTVALLSLIATVSISPHHIFFILQTPAAASNSLGIFSSVSQAAFVLSFLAMTLTTTASYSSGRTLFTGLIPKGREGEYFALYSIGGTATIWLAPLLVAVFTNAFHSLQWGIGSIVVLLALGLFAVALVDVPLQPWSTTSAT